MKKYLLTMVMIFALVSVSFAQTNNFGNNAVGNLSPGSVNTTGNNNTINGTGPTNIVGGAGGIGYGGTGGTGGSATGGAATATVGNVTGGAATIGNVSGGSVGNIANTQTNTFNPTVSPSATIQKGAIDNTNIVAPDIKNTNVNTNNVDIKNSNAQGQKQGQDQNQKQGQIQGQGQMNNWVQTFEDKRELPNALPVIPQVIPLIQGGRVGDVTGQVVKFAIAAKPYNGELVVRILKVVNGSIFDRVRLEDVEEDLLKVYIKLSQKVDGKKVRYIVQYKDSAMGSGLSLGGAGSISGLNGGSSTYGGTGSVGTGVGYTRSTADPQYILKFFLVE